MTSSSSLNPVIKCCLFDMDGLLINTEDIYTLSTSLLLKQYNRPPMTWEFKTQVMGLPGPEVYKKFVKYFNLEGMLTQEEYSEKQHKIQEQLWETCAFLPGVEDMLNYLYAIGIPIAICTSSTKVKFDLKIVNSIKKLIEKFDAIILGDDERLEGGFGKPHPRIYELGLEAVNSKNCTNIKPSETIVFEDAVLGCQAGKAFGANVCWIPHTELFCKISDFKKDFDGEKDATVIQSMSEFPFKNFEFLSVKK
ncbi:hypothetical protein QEN19_004189 [Hanseniaspora menglaensis]